MASRHPFLQRRRTPSLALSVSSGSDSDGLLKTALCFGTATPLHADSKNDAIGFKGRAKGHKDFIKSLVTLLKIW